MLDIRLSYKISMGDYIKINIWSGLEKTKFLKIVYRYLFFAIDFIILIFSIFAGMPVEYFIILGLLAFFPIGLRLSVIRKAKKAYLRSQIFQNYEISLIFRDKEIEESLFTRKFTYNWTNVKLVQEESDLIIIIVENSRILYAPISAFPEREFETFKEFCLNNLNPKFLKFKKIK